MYVYSFNEGTSYRKKKQCIRHLRLALQALCAVTAELKAVKLNVSVITRLRFINHQTDDSRCTYLLQQKRNLRYLGPFCCLAQNNSILIFF